VDEDEARKMKMTWRQIPYLNQRGRIVGSCWWNVRLRWRHASFSL